MKAAKNRDDILKAIAMMERHLAIARKAGVIRESETGPRRDRP
jgi:hypothetical protein